MSTWSHMSPRSPRSLRSHGNHVHLRSPMSPVANAAAPKLLELCSARPNWMRNPFFLDCCCFCAGLRLEPSEPYAIYEH